MRFHYCMGVGHLTMDGVLVLAADAILACEVVKSLKLAKRELHNE